MSKAVTAQYDKPRLSTGQHVPVLVGVDTVTTNLDRHIFSGCHIHTALYTPLLP